MSTPRMSGPSVMSLSLALLAGLGGGLLARAYPHPVTDSLFAGLDVLVRAWTNALRAIVLPLIVSQLFLAVGMARGKNSQSSRLGLAIPAVFAALLTVSALLTLVGVSGLLRLPALASLGWPVSTKVPGPALAAGAAAPRWIDGLIPSNLVAASSTDNILPVMIFTCLFALAARRATSNPGPLDQLAGAVRDTTLVLVGWLMAASPVIIFALTCRMTGQAGLGVGGVVLTFVVIESVALVGCAGALYPLVAMFGRTGLVAFARAAVPSQLVALTTRSSLATVPSLMLAAEQSLRLSPVVTASVIPLAGATLKLSRAVSNSTKFLFLTHVLGIPLTPGQVAVFTATVLLMSPATLGVPSVASATRSLPAYVAAGIPAEYVVLLGATTWMMDMLMTLLNSTGYLAAAVLVERVAGPARSLFAVQGRPDAAARAGETGTASGRWSSMAVLGRANLRRGSGNEG
jgi:Na+/H+-dicarboxylate symporter